MGAVAGERASHTGARIAFAPVAANHALDQLTERSEDWTSPGVESDSGTCCLRRQCAQAWKPGSQHAGEKRGVAGQTLGV